MGVNTYLRESDYWWRVLAQEDDDGQQVVVLKVNAWTALALAERDEVHLRPEAQETLKDIRWAIGEAVE